MKHIIVYWNVEIVGFALMTFAMVMSLCPTTRFIYPLVVGISIGIIFNGIRRYEKNEPRRL